MIRSRSLTQLDADHLRADRRASAPHDAAVGETEVDLRPADFTTSHYPTSVLVIVSELDADTGAEIPPDGIVNGAGDPDTVKRSARRHRRARWRGIEQILDTSENPNTACANVK
jgi:hypothetical protein